MMKSKKLHQLMITGIVVTSVITGCSSTTTDTDTTAKESTVTENIENTASSDAMTPPDGEKPDGEPPTGDMPDGSQPPSDQPTDMPGNPPDGSAPDGSQPPDGADANGQGFNVSNGSAVETTGVYVLDNETATENDLTITSNTSNESTVKVTNGATLTLIDATLNKASGDMTVEEASDFFGANAGVLVSEGGQLSITGSTIITTASGGNAIFSTGETSSITITDSSISTTKDHSRGLDATYGGTIDADGIVVDTLGAHAAAVATDRGEGTITVNNSELNTAGEGSPVIYSTGNITVNNSVGNALGSSLAIIEGKNSIMLENTSLEGYALGRGSGDGIDQSGVMIYQSMSGDAADGSGSFTSKNTSLTINEDSKVYETAPMFFVTNTSAEIYLENTNLKFGSGILLNIAGNDGEWGTSGENGGDVIMKAKDQTLSGDITLDAISTLDLTLNSSVFNGTVNANNTAKAVTIFLSSDSTWHMTDDAYVTGITLEDTKLSNINSNGFNIYYDADDNANQWLGGKTLSLPGGGSLLPL